MAEVQVQFDVHPERNKVCLRVAMNRAQAAVRQVHLPCTSEARTSGEVTTFCLGPDQWMLVSDRLSSAELISRTAESLSGVPHHAVDVSSAFFCVRLGGARARDLLAMGSGIDWACDHVLQGECRRTLFARIAVVAHAIQRDTFELYFDRTYRTYLETWFAHASSDPLLSTLPCHTSF